MPLQDELCFVQFIHPGGEHRPRANTFMEWNRRAHKRKFIEISGRCQKGRSAFHGPLRFWAEWEPQSDVVPIQQPAKHGPHFVHRPFYKIPESYGGLQNTDPFVFGHFFYTGCQQNTRRGPTQLRFLDHGSVILFGSCVDERFFVLDTVFVVDSWEDHNAKGFKRLKRLVPKIYWEVTLLQWYTNVNGADCGVRGSPASWRFYRGATYDKPVAGMFSFFPCVPANQSSQGFARPLIAIEGAITGQLRQGKRLNRGLDSAKVVEHWNSVRKQVESQHLWLGVHAREPERRN